eukprot:ANDGO_02224.mRNA.1 Cullin homolog 1
MNPDARIREVRSRLEPEVLPNLRQRIPQRIIEEYDAIYNPLVSEKLNVFFGMCNLVYSGKATFKQLALQKMQVKHTAYNGVRKLIDSHIFSDDNYVPRLLIEDLLSHVESFIHACADSVRDSMSVDGPSSASEALCVIKRLLGLWELLLDSVIPFLLFLASPIRDRLTLLFPSPNPEPVLRRKTLARLADVFDSVQEAKIIAESVCLLLDQLSDVGNDAPVETNVAFLRRMIDMLKDVDLFDSSFRSMISESMCRRFVSYCRRFSDMPSDPDPAVPLKLIDHANLQVQKVLQVFPADFAKLLSQDILHYADALLKLEDRRSSLLCIFSNRNLDGVAKLFLFNCTLGKPERFFGLLSSFLQDAVSKLFKSASAIRTSSFSELLNTLRLSVLTDLISVFDLLHSISMACRAVSPANFEDPRPENYKIALSKTMSATEFHSKISFPQILALDLIHACDESRVEAVVNIVDFVVDKDVFFAEFQCQLCRMLFAQNFVLKQLKSQETESLSRDAVLSAGSSSSTLEFALSSLRKIDASNMMFSRVKKMYEDVSVASDIQRNFERHVSSQHLHLPVEFKVHVLSGGKWPVEMRRFANDDHREKLILPRELEVARSSFTEYYSQVLHRGSRTLLWFFSESRGDVLATFSGSNQTRLLCRLNTFQISVLILFNTKSQMTFSELCLLSGTEARIALPVVRSLCNASKKNNVLMLLDEPETEVRGADESESDPKAELYLCKPLADSSVITVNEQFSSVRYKIGFPLMKFPTEEETKATREATEEDRQYLIDATIVRLMKCAKRMNMQALLGAVTEQLNSKFRVDLRMVKRRIDTLIDREFLQREHSEEGDFLTYI